MKHDVSFDFSQAYIVTKTYKKKKLKDLQNKFRLYIKKKSLSI